MKLQRHIRLFGRELTERVDDWRWRVAARRTFDRRGFVCGDRYFQRIREDKARFQTRGFCCVVESPGSHAVQLLTFTSGRSLIITVLVRRQEAVQSNLKGSDVGVFNPKKKGIFVAIRT